MCLVTKWTRVGYNLGWQAWPSARLQFFPCRNLWSRAVDLLALCAGQIGNNALDVAIDAGQGYAIDPCCAIHLLDEVHFQAMFPALELVNVRQQLDSGLEALRAPRSPCA